MSHVPRARPRVLNLAGQIRDKEPGTGRGEVPNVPQGVPTASPLGSAPIDMGVVLRLGNSAVVRVVVRTAVVGYQYGGVVRTVIQQNPW